MHVGGPNGNIFVWQKTLAAAAKAAGRTRPLFINNCHNSVQGKDPTNDSAVSFPAVTDLVPFMHEDEVNMTGDQLLVCPMHSWRVSHDNNPDFNALMAVLQSTLPFASMWAPITRPGCWPDPDMLQIHGMKHDMAGARSHVSAWAIASAPMVISFDLTDTPLLADMWPLISNKHVLEINSAWAGHPGTVIAQSSRPPSNGSGVSPHGNEHLRTQWQLWGKPLPGGRVAALAINFDGYVSLNVTFSFAQFPAQWWGATRAPMTVKALDVWTGVVVESADGATDGGGGGGWWQTETLDPHACQMLILEAVQV